MKKTIVAQIMKSKAKPADKIIQLFAVVMTNYRKPLGDAAWKGIAELAGADYGSALAFLTGFLIGHHGCPDHERWLELLPTKK